MDTGQHSSQREIEFFGNLATTESCHERHQERFLVTIVQGGQGVLKHLLTREEFQDVVVGTGERVVYPVETLRWLGSSPAVSEVVSVTMA